ncbi:Glyco-hydro-47 domain containing protein [Pyrenophora tritici-repentis]|nr:Glyco-hydro-47 domain containing protein [Pyrenophora tritici-repentis]
MEFTRLSELTGEPKWFDAVNRVIKVLDEQQSKTQLPGMWPTIVNASNADFTSDGGFTLGSMSDSTYEYFGKQYALLGGRDPIYRKMYEKSMETASKHALYRPSTPDNTDMLMAGFVRVEKQKIYLDPEMQHLSCYTGGMFALGGKIFQNDEHVEIGRKLANTCVWAYRVSPVGIMPEVSHLLNCKDKKTCKWDEKAWLDGIRLRTADSNEEKDPVKNIANLRLPTGFTSIEDRRYLLRPEAIESVFVMWRITGERQWQNAAWNMWTAIMKVTDTDIGNSALRDVSANPPPREDSMESFWMAETLKYFYLIFSEPSVISLDDWVFNTEAHPFKIPKP